MTTPEDYSAAVDRALEKLVGMSAREASERFGFGRETISAWRRRRAAGELILEIRGKNVAALQRLFATPVPDRIPISLARPLRRRLL